MKQNYTVALNKISKKYHTSSPNPLNIFNQFHSKNHSEKKQAVWALKDISLNISKGEEVGVIGLNGAGKSTLLRIIAGITLPSSGIIATSGRAVSLIKLESGLHPDLSGRENLFLNGLLLGMTKSEIRSKTNIILRFASLGKYVDFPIHTYSEGMKFRLSFSIAIHAQPDLVVLDETLAFSDQMFLNKALNKFSQMVSSGMSVIIATHNLSLLKTYSHKIVWLDRGQVKKIGKPQTVISQYKNSLTSK